MVSTEKVFTLMFPNSEYNECVFVNSSLDMVENKKVKFRIIIILNGSYFLIYIKSF